MADRPLWFVFKMKKAQIREIEMFVSPLLSMELGSVKKTEGINQSFKAPMIPDSARVNKNRRFNK